MPSDWLWMDSSVPPLDAGDTVDQKIQQLQTYVYMLAQQLRYSLQNLGLANFNGTELENFQNAFAPAKHYHLFEDVEGMPLLVSRGGTGAVTVDAARKNLGLQQIRSGSWLPTVQYVSTYSSTPVGMFLRIGDSVLVSFYIEISKSVAQSVNNREISISGLPFHVAEKSAGGGLCAAGGLVGGTGFSGFYAKFDPDSATNLTIVPRMNNTYGALTPVYFGEVTERDTQGNPTSFGDARLTQLAGTLLYLTNDD